MGSILKPTAIRKFAKGQSCQIRLPFICSHNTDETILAHRNGGGMAMKHLDIHASFACSKCHAAVDDGNRKYVTPSGHKSEYSKSECDKALDEGVFRTQTILFKKGLLFWDGAELNKVEPEGFLKLAWWVDKLVHNRK